MPEGYIYILSNPAMPGLLKIGKTTLSTEVRAETLTRSTGVPAPFLILKSYKVMDCDVAERKAHDVLERAVGRPNSNREFFNGPEEIVCSILDDLMYQFLVPGEVNLERFADALRHLENKEFSLACTEFEWLLKQESDGAPVTFLINSDLGRMLGMHHARRILCKLRCYQPKTNFFTLHYRSSLKGEPHAGCR